MGFFSELDIVISEAVSSHFADVVPDVIRLPKEVTGEINVRIDEPDGSLSYYDEVIDVADEHANYFDIALEAGPLQVVVAQAASLKEAIALQGMITAYLN